MSDSEKAFEQFVLDELAEGDEEVALAMLEKGSDGQYRTVATAAAWKAWSSRGELEHGPKVGDAGKPEE